MTDEAGGGAVRPKASRIPRAFDPAAPIFFTSHATAHGSRLVHPTADANGPFATFFRHLSEDVGQLVAGGPAGSDPGFLDRGMRAGVDWEREILTAVGGCQVFIALLSAPFARSEYCGKEFDAFTRRQTWLRAKERRMPGPHCVLPVIWAPNTQIPLAVSRFQIFRPEPFGNRELATDYEREGIYGLFRAEGPEGPVYRGTVWRLAQQIQRLVDTYWVEPWIPKDSGGLDNVFDERAGEE